MKVIFAALLGTTAAFGGANAFGVSSHGDDDYYYDDAYASDTAAVADTGGSDTKPTPKPTAKPTAKPTTAVKLCDSICTGICKDPDHFKQLAASDCNTISGHLNLFLIPGKSDFKMSNIVHIKGDLIGDFAPNNAAYGFKSFDMSSLKFVDGNLQFNNNRWFQGDWAFPSLQRVGGHLHFFANFGGDGYGMTSMSFPSLETVNGKFAVDYNVKMTSLDLPNLSHVGSFDSKHAGHPLYNAHTGTKTDYKFGKKENLKEQIKTLREREKKGGNANGGFHPASFRVTFN